MAPRNSCQPLQTFLDDYISALDKLTCMGVRTGNGRLLAYRRHLQAAVEKEKACPEADHAHQQAPRFLNALLEASEIIDIASLDLGLLSGHEVKTKFRKLASGPEVLDPTRDDPARNYAFEFCTAATAAHHGHLLGFAAGDLEVGPPACPIECKRISSLKRLGSNFADARTQLAAGGRPGIVAIDLSAPIRNARGLVVRCESELAQQLRVDQELEAYLARYLDAKIIGQVVDPMVMGVAFRHVVVGSVGSSEQIRTSRTWQLLAVHPGNPLDDQFRQSLGWLGDTPIVSGTGEDLERAEKEIFGL